MAYFGCINKSSSPSKRIFKSEYEIIYDEVYGLSNGRTYKKVNPSEEDTCIVGAFYYRDGNNIYGDPFCLIGLNETDPVYKSSYNNSPFPYLGTIKRAGKTFYYSASQHFWNNGSLESNPANKIIAINTISTPFSSYLEGVSALLNLALVNGAETLTYKWDFTKSVDPLVDEIIGVQVTNQNGILGEHGITFNNKQSGMTIPTGFKFGFTYEFDIYEGIPEEVQRTFISYGSSNSIVNFYNQPQYGHQCWGIFDYNSHHYGVDPLEAEDVNLNNNILKIIHNGTEIDIYKDEKLMLHAENLNANWVNTGINFNVGRIGSSDTYNTLTIKALRIYENE